MSKSKPVLLIVDDERSILRASERMYSKSFNVIVTDDPERAMALIEYCDACLFDWDLGMGRTTAELWREAKATGKPFFVVTGTPEDADCPRVNIRVKPANPKQITKELLQDLKWFEGKHLPSSVGTEEFRASLQCTNWLASELPQYQRERRKENYGRLGIDINEGDA